MAKRSLCNISMAIALAAAGLGHAQETMVLLANGELAGWKPQKFEKIPKTTQFEIVEEDENPSTGLVLEAVAEDSASGYIMEKDIPFGPDAVLELSYKVFEAVNSEDEKSKAGDDFAFRFYLSSRSLMVHRTLILVHSNQYPAGESWTSPYDGALAKFEVHAISGKGQKGDWVQVRVPVGKLWQEKYGSVPDELVGMAFMVDSDNAHGKMHTRIASISYKT